MNRFLVWDGTRYRADEMMESDRLAKATSLSILEEAAAADTTTDSQLLARWAATSQGEPALRRMLTLVRSEPGITVSASALDAHPMLFNVLNGTLDLSSGKLRPHDRTGLHTKRSDVRWDKTATCPRFQAYLEKAPSRRLADFAEAERGAPRTEPEFQRHAMRGMPIAVGTTLDGPLTLVEGYTRSCRALRDHHDRRFDGLPLPIIVGVSARIEEWPWW